MRKYTIKGKTYIFDRYKFIDILGSILLRKEGDGSVTQIHQIDIFNRIADKVGLSSPDAVKQWKRGKGCPADVERVKACAEVLGVNFMELLTPCVEKEMSKLNDKEVALLEKVFAGCMNCYYEKAEWLFDSTIDKEQRWDLENSFTDKVLEHVEEMHLLTDQNALYISEDIRYRIHRFLNDFKEEYDIWDMKPEWKQIQSESEGSLPQDISMFIPIEHSLCFGEIKTHEQGVYVHGLFYIDEEINLATKLSYDYPEIPDEYYDDTSLDGESLDENGNPRDLTPLAHPEFGLTPKILFKDYATRLMKNAFRVEFPEIEHMFA